MSSESVLPFDIIAQIIDNVGENEDTDLLKELALVSHSLNQICTKHLFATVELHDADPGRHIASSKKGFVKLLKSRPDVVKYIRKLTYNAGNCYRSIEDPLLSPILPNLLRTISRLNCLTITTSSFPDWNSLDSYLTSAFLYLMHLPTVNQIDLSSIQNFPPSSLTLSVNLHRLDILDLRRFDTFEDNDGSSEIVVQSEMPKLREFHTSSSTLLTTKLLHAKRRDGRRAFNFVDLRRLSISTIRHEDEQNIRYMLQNAKLLDKLHLSFDLGWNLVGLRDILSPTERTLKVLDLTVFFSDYSVPLLHEGQRIS